MMGRVDDGMEIVKCENIWKIYNQGTDAEVQALKGISLRIKKGENIAIVGTSGSGKSTLLHTIGCLDRPTRGKVIIDGEDVSSLSGNELSKLRNEKIGFVFQSFYLIPNLNALENVVLPAIFSRSSKAEREKKAKELLKRFGLGHRIYHKPSELSGGEVQRVAVARALMNDPEILLADEPTGNLDSKSGEEIMKTLLELNKNEKVTLITITHDLNIASYAQRIIHLKDGMIVREVRN